MLLLDRDGGRLAKVPFPQILFPVRKSENIPSTHKYLHLSSSVGMAYITAAVLSFSLECSQQLSLHLTLALVEVECISKAQDDDGKSYCMK